MYNVVFPIFILEKDSKDIARFDSIYQMQRQLEEIDIENHEYEAWDSAGASLSLQVQEPVWLQITPSSDLAPAALREVLVNYATRLGIEVNGQDEMNTAELFNRITAAKQKAQPKK